MSGGVVDMDLDKKISLVERFGNRFGLNNKKQPKKVKLKPHNEKNNKVQIVYRVQRKEKENKNTMNYLELAKIRQECERSFRNAGYEGDVEKLNEVFHLAGDKIRDRYVIEALHGAVSNNHQSIIENFPKKLIENIDLDLVGNLFTNMEREKENESLKLLINRISDCADELNYVKGFEMLSQIRKGDLVYGLGNARNPVLLGMFEYGNHPTVDRLNNKIMDTDEADCPYYGSHGTRDTGAIRHASYLERHPKYNPLFIDERDSDARDLRVKRACKAGITNILEGSKEYNLHFILIDFDPLKALEKREKGTSFTNSELRLIYRKWLENPASTDKRIIFWDENFNKKSPTEFFNSLANEFKYVPKSLKSEGLMKLQEWAQKKDATHSLKDKS